MEGSLFVTVLILIVALGFMFPPTLTVIFMILSEILSLCSETLHIFLSFTNDYHRIHVVFPHRGITLSIH